MQVVLPRWLSALCLALALPFAACEPNDRDDDDDGDVDNDQPDMAVSVSVTVQTVNVSEQACPVALGCTAAGSRRLLLPDLTVINHGDSLRLGNRVDLEGEDVVDESCLEGKALAFGAWRVKNTNGDVLSDGTLVATCIADDAPVAGDRTPNRTCDNWGITRDFIATIGLACPGIDVGDLDDGDYVLDVTAFDDARFDDDDLDDNSASVSFSISSVCDGQLCGGVCCPSEYACIEDQCQLPDLAVDLAALQSDLSLSTENFSEQNCAIAEGCLSGGGDRRLLRFTTKTPNIGLADFVVGVPEDSPNASFSQCHGHYHYHDYAAYRLLDGDDNLVATGAKQAFCLLDLSQVDPNAGNAKYDCGFQGVSVGWADEYYSGLDCQWIDVTGVAPGTYTLELEVNPARIIPELDYTNNTARVQVEITADPNQCLSAEEVCYDGIDQDCDDVADDGCPPISGNDSCATAAQIGPGDYTAELVAETDDALATSCGSAAGRAALFRFTLPMPQLVYFSTYGSDMDTVLDIKEGNDCATADATVCVDDACDAAQSHILRRLDAGTYWLTIKAKDANALGTIKLKAQMAQCTGAEVLDDEAFSTSVSGTWEGATNQKDAVCGGANSGPERMWAIAACPGDSTLHVDTCHSPFADSVVDIRDGGCNGQSVQCNDDAQALCNGGNQASDVTTTLSHDGMYFVVVDAFHAGATAPFQADIALSREP